LHFYRRNKSRAAESFCGDNATIPLKFAAVAAANDNDVGGIARPHSVAARRHCRRRRRRRRCRRRRRRRHRQWRRLSARESFVDRDARRDTRRGAASTVGENGEIICGIRTSTINGFL